MLYNPFTVWRGIRELTIHCGLPMGVHTEELLKTKFFCSSYTGSFEALHTVEQSADTVLNNCSYSHFAPLPRMQQDCRADPVGAGSRGCGEGDQAGMVLQLCCRETLQSPFLSKQQPQGWDHNSGFATQVCLCWISAQSKVSEFSCKESGVGRVTDHTQQQHKYHCSTHR